MGKSAIIFAYCYYVRDKKSSRLPILVWHTKWCLGGDGCSLQQNENPLISNYTSARRLFSVYNFGRQWFGKVSWTLMACNGLCSIFFTFILFWRLAIAIGPLWNVACLSRDSDIMLCAVYEVLLLLQSKHNRLQAHFFKHANAFWRKVYPGQVPINCEFQVSVKFHYGSK